MAYDGSLNFNTKVDSSGFNKATKNAGQSLGGFKNTLLKIGAAAAAAFSVKAVVDFGKKAIETASDMAEVQNVVDTSFGSMSYKMEEFADTAIEQFGISKLAAKQTGSTFMAMASGMGVAQGAASDMSVSLTGLSADMASFYNVDQATASTALKSVFTGETETLKQFGIVMTDANLKAFALSQGITKDTSAMTQAEKVQLRYAFVMKTTALAQGDFAKTSDGWANQTRILSEKWKEFSATIGTLLMNVVLPVVQRLNDGMSALIKTASNLSKSLGFKSESKSAQSTSKAISSAVDNQNALTDAVEDTTEANKKAELSFDNINTLSGETADKKTESSAIEQSGGLGQYSGAQTVKVDADTSGFDEKIQFAIGILKSFKAALDPIAKFTWQAIRDFYNNCLKPIGEWTVGVGLPHFADSLKNLSNSIDWEKIRDSLKTLWESVKPFSIKIGEGMLWFFDNILSPLSSWVISDVVPAFLKLLSGAIDFLNSAIDDLKPVWEWFWENVKKPINDFVGNAFVDMLNGIGDALKWISGNELAMTILEGVAIGIILVCDAVAIWNVVGVIASAVTKAFAAAVTFLTSPLTLICLAIVALIAIVIVCIKYWDKIKEVAVSCWNAICSAFSSVGKFFKEKVIDPVGKLFSGLWEGLVSGFKSAVNGLIWFANRFIDGLNKLLFPVRAIIYGVAKAFGQKISFENIKIPHIPKLATGAVIPGGSEFLAVLGDQPKGQTNIEAPLDTIVDAFKQAQGTQSFNVTATGDMAQLVKLLKLKFERADHLATAF